MAVLRRRLVTVAGTSPGSAAPASRSGPVGPDAVTSPGSADDVAVVRRLVPLVRRVALASAASPAGSAPVGSPLSADAVEAALSVGSLWSVGS
jgi:hypothetical protein